MHTTGRKTLGKPFRFSRGRKFAISVHGQVASATYQVFSHSFGSNGKFLSNCDIYPKTHLEFHKMTMQARTPDRVEGEPRLYRNDYGCFASLLLKID